jgi:hypothetical protein
MIDIQERLIVLTLALLFIILLFDKNLDRGANILQISLK